MLSQAPATAVSAWSGVGLAELAQLGVQRSQADPEDAGRVGAGGASAPTSQLTRPHALAL